MKMITFPLDASQPHFINSSRGRSSPLRRKIALPTLDGYVFKEVEQIVILEADGNYTRLKFTDDTQILVCKTLRHTEEMLAGHPQFIRIHRSFSINLNRLEKYVRGKGGYVIMENGQSVGVSNGRKPQFMKALAHYFN